MIPTPWSRHEDCYQRAEVSADPRGINRAGKEIGMRQLSLASANPHLGGALMITGVVTRTIMYGKVGGPRFGDTPREG